MVKVTKGLAKKMYDEGHAIMVLPCNLRADSKLASWISKPDDKEATFEKLCDAVFYYNCSPETGMSLAYYVKEV